MDDAEAADRLAGMTGGGIASFRLWHFPPDEPWTTWTLFTDGRLREAAWDRREGFSLREAELSEDEVRHFRANAAFLGLDPEDVGTTLAVSEFGIEGCAQGISVVRWDRPVPAGLRAIAAWHSRTRAGFRERLDADASAK